MSQLKQSTKSKPISVKHFSSNEIIKRKSNSHLPIGNAYMHRRLKAVHLSPTNLMSLQNAWVPLGQFSANCDLFFAFSVTNMCKISCFRWDRVHNNLTESRCSDFNMVKEYLRPVCHLWELSTWTYLFPRVVLPVPNPSHSWAALQPAPWSPGLPLRKPHRFPWTLWQLLLWPVWHRHDLCSWLDQWIRTLAAKTPDALPNRRLWQRGWVVERKYEISGSLS